MIKRKQKYYKNPYIDDTSLNRLASAIILGQLYSLVTGLTYYHQGKICRDCDKPFYDCECEKCDDCGWPRCVCDLEFNSREDVTKYSWNLIKQKLNDNDLEKLADKIYHIYNNNKNEYDNSYQSVISTKIFKIMYKYYKLPVNETNSKKLIKELRNIK